jgi:ryanodine receptor 2
VADGAAERSEYRPTPLDTSAVILDDELVELIEVLAENTHDTWAQARLSAGWRHGPCRDDEERLHPCLLPYADLEEEEKDIDRTIVVATVRALVVLGYELRRRSS